MLYVENALKNTFSPLSNLRVLDLTDKEKGSELCGRILGDFGADVLKIEPSGRFHFTLFESLCS